MRRRGFTLLELLIYGIILAVVSSAVLAIVVTMGRTQAEITALPAAQAEAQDAITAVASFVRRAPLCDAAAGCNDVIDSALQSADEDSLAVYTNSGGTTATFQNEDGALVRTIGKRVETIVPESLTMRYQYALSPSLTYTMGTTAESITWHDSVATADLKSVMAVRITATVAKGNVVSIQSSIVRLRNSPKKVFTTS